MTKPFCLAAAGLALAISAAPVAAMTINIQPFSAAAYQNTVAGLGSVVIEDFETVLGPHQVQQELSGPLSTAVGTFSTLGGTGTGGSVIGTGTQLSLKNDTQPPNNFGRFNTTPGGSWFLDSNDTDGIRWDISASNLFRTVGFTLSDAADQGARLVISSVLGTVTTDLATLANRPNAEVNLITIDFGELVSEATILFSNTYAKDRRNDGFSLDDVFVAPIPLPAPLLMLLAALGALVALRRRTGATAA